MDVYDRIKMTRKALGWSQTELAKKSGYAEKSMIARIENKQVDLSLSKLELIAQALGVSAAYLFGVSDKQEQKDRIMMYASNITDLIEKFQALDDIDRERMVERVDTLLEADKYQED